MIPSFSSKETEKIWLGERIKNLPNEIQEIGRRKLRMLNTALRLSKYFGTSSKFWLGLQDDYDPEEGELLIHQELLNIQALHQKGCVTTCVFIHHFPFHAFLCAGTNAGSPLKGLPVPPISDISIVFPQVRICLPCLLLPYRLRI